MRIVAGDLKGQVLAAPKSDKIRPTTDRTRESLFNILGHQLGFSFDGARIIDLFAGTGAVGFEALSRGAEFALFVEEAAEARGLIRKNMENLRLNGRTKIFRRDATKLGASGTMHPFTLAFLDPPYGKRLGERALVSLHQGEWLEKDAIVILEEASDADITIPPQFTLNQTREYGSTIMRLMTYIG